MAMLSLPPADEFLRRAHLALGRALSVACNFESNCRSMAFVLKIKEPKPDGQSDDESFVELQKAVLGRLVDLNRLIARRVAMKDDYAQMLHAARDARNYIAHEAADELERLAKRTADIEEWRSLLEGKLRELALGKIIIAILLSRNTAEPTPTREEIDAYPDQLVAWVTRGDA